MVYQVCLEELDQRVNRDYQDKMAILVVMDREETKETQDLREIRDRKAKRDQQEILDHQDQPDHLVFLDHQVCLDQLAPRDRQDPLAQQDLPVILVKMVALVRPCIHAGLCLHVLNRISTRHIVESTEQLLSSSYHTQCMVIKQ